jgi:hypothetical protein
MIGEGGTGDERQGRVGLVKRAGRARPLQAQRARVQAQIETRLGLVKRAGPFEAQGEQAWPLQAWWGRFERDRIRRFGRLGWVGRGSRHWRLRRSEELCASRRHRRR